MLSLRVPRLPTLLTAIALLALVAAACGGDDDDDAGDGADAQTRDFSAQAVGEAFDVEAQPVVVNSALAVGPNRLTLGFFRSDGSLILDATGSIRLYRVAENGSGSFVAEHELQRAAIAQQSDHTHGDGSLHVHEDEFAAIFYVNVDFDRPGDWAAELNIELDGEPHFGLLTQSFDVLARTPEPNIGDPLPASTNITLSDVDDVSEINSSPEPVPAMNELTVAEALATGKPVLVAIATPSFCQTRFCGPLMEEVVVPLWEQFGDKVQFVHVEPFDLAEARDNGRLVPVSLLSEWSLQTEPWIFVADRDGLVAAKFEGIAALDEVRAVLMDVVSANPAK